MNLLMPVDAIGGYTSHSQQARIVTELWAARELYCPNCLKSKLTPTPVNAQAVDFDCSVCKVPFQLKSSKSKFSQKVADGAYSSMINAIRNDNFPDLFLLNYSRTDWCVRDLMVIPRFALTEQSIIARKPLASTARRAGWIGCIIDLTNIAPEARISLIKNSQSVSPASVAETYAKLKPLKELKVRERGWTLALLTMIQKAGWREFQTNQVYQFEQQLHLRFPANRHLRHKIRQQLQVLRDLGLLQHTSRGSWSLV